MHTKSQLWFAVTVVLACGSAHAHEDDQACFPEEARSELTAIAPMLSQQSNELAQQLVEENAPASTMYQITRQQVLLERMQRRVESRGIACVSAIDSLRRDYTILTRIFEAYAKGDKSLEIERLTSSEAQTLLDSVADPLKKLGAVIERLPSD